MEYKTYDGRKSVHLLSAGDIYFNGFGMKYQHQSNRGKTWADGNNVLIKKHQSESDASAFPAGRRVTVCTIIFREVSMKCSWIYPVRVPIILSGYLTGRVFLKKRQGFTKNGPFLCRRIMAAFGTIWAGDKGGQSAGGRSCLGQGALGSASYQRRK
jgi:hypothetical protein